MSDYFPNPVTLEQHLSNCQFQLDNVRGWVMAQRDGKTDLLPAEMKAECLAESASAVFAAVQAERAPVKPSKAGGDR
jgi:hypothetical protein